MYCKEYLTYLKVQDLLDVVVTVVSSSGGN